MENLNLTVLLTGLIAYIGVALKSLPGLIWRFIKARMSSTIFVTSLDKYQYDKIIEYLNSFNKKIFKDNFLARDYGPNEVYNSIAPGEYTIRIKRFLYLFVNINKESTKQQGTFISDDKYIINLHFFGMGRRKEHKKIVDRLNTPEQDNCITRIILNGSGIASSKIEKRGMDTLFINNKNLLVNTIDNWKENKEFYKSHGIIYKLGILVDGEPGTGKSTLGKVVASYLNYDLYYIDLSCVNKNPENVLRMLSDIVGNSVVVMEDIDCVLGNREGKEATAESIKLTNSILNFLDGIVSPENCIIIASTNYKDRLDPAIKRPGRFDLQLELGKIDYEIAKEMCDSFNVDINSLDIELPINPSKLQNKLIMNYKANSIVVEDEKMMI